MMIPRHLNRNLWIQLLLIYKVIPLIVFAENTPADTHNLAKFEALDSTLHIIPSDT